MADGHRVFITGFSALTASGATANETWAAVRSGDSGIAEITQWDLSSWTHRLGGELKNVQPVALLPDRKLMKVISRQDVLGIHAAVQAVEHSQLPLYRDTLDSPDAFNDSTAVYVGSSGNKYFQQYDFLPLLAKSKGEMQAFAGQLFSEVHPMWLLRILPNNVLAYTGITYGFKGPNQNIANHAVSGTQAIMEAYHAIQSGQAERAVVVAYDVAIEPQALYYYEKLGVLSPRHLKPFDGEHDGTLLAEGAAALVLESEESALRRGAKCYAQLLGGLSSTEAAGLFSLEAEGEHLALLISELLDNLQLSPTDIDLIVAHGNGNPSSDISEAYALREAFKDHFVPVTAFKWSMGHTVCASGVVDAVLTTYALREQCVPGVANFDRLAAGCQGLNISRHERPLVGGKTHALLINRGFASMNACLVIKSI
jgi:3-oxoacyl-[acyl-carrier-protein] synthase-1